ncbi:PGPGW domain-containing protein [Nocardiopsis lambiniae]|uniref:PGPGW domain-containing protein n=1 Tax=Nocardiopsis lambiniae TaxID=3075539 RepID=A0ABU2M7R7_9ACTN|nr:PGPGW domain-containing protein [Nocardiopsis sp. DSM 44743]MDT0328675.1 PGPGW domain-containing protein [Nocardiopsis sp. DSM 44743]
MHAHPVLHLPWLILVGTVGTLIILAGVVMLVAPGPGVAAIILGLVVLSTEFSWARRLVRPARVWFRRAERYGMRLRARALERYRARRALRRERLTSE